VRAVKTLLAVVAGTTLLAVLAVTAGATRLASSETRIVARFSNAEFSGPFGTSRCPITLEGSFHEGTIVKTLGRLLGFITGGSIGVCPSGSATLLTESLPWHMAYLSFTGSLPNITSLSTNLIGFGLRVRTGMESCLIRSTTTEPVKLTFNREPGGVLTSLELGGSIRTGPECFSVRGTLRGESDGLSAGRLTLI